MILDDIAVPTARSGHNMLYDAVNEDIILFGGMKDNNNVEGSYLNDTWLYNYSENHWSEVQSSIGPGDRNTPAMVYDPTKERVILFGGINQDYFFNDTWELDLNTYEWSKIETVNTPGFVADAGLVFDEVNQEIVLFGGHWQFGYFEETWIFNVNDDTWTKLNTTVFPTQRYGHRMVYSTKKQSIVLFAGHAYNVSDTVNNDMWIYDCLSKEWSELITDPVPPTRYWHDIAYDEVNEKIVMFGGRLNWFNFDCRGDTWEFDEETNQWNEISTEPNPGERMTFSMVYHEEAERIILFGGNENPYTSIFNDLWEYNPKRSQWKQIDISKTNFDVTLYNLLAIIMLASLIQRSSKRRKDKRYFIRKS